MNILSTIGTFIASMPSSVFMALVLFALCLVFRAGVQTAVRSGLSFAVGLIGVNMLMSLAIETLTPVAEGISTRFSLSLDILDLGYGAMGGVMVWPGHFIVMFAIVVIDVIMLLLKWTKTLWVDMHNVWHGSYVGMITYVITRNTWLSVLLALVSMVISLKLADYHAKRFQEFNEIGNITLISTMATIPATFSMLVMKVIDRIPGLNKVDVKSDNLKDKFGVWGENMTIGAILGLVLSLLAGYNFVDSMTMALTLAATLALFPKMAAVMIEGMIPLSTSVTAVMKKRFKGRELNIAVDGAILLGHPSVMSTFVLMVPISVVLSFIVPGIGFIPIASLTALPYFIGAIVPYTRGNIVHTLIVTTLFVIFTGLIASYMAPFVTESISMAGYHTNEIAAGVQMTGWDEGGNIFTWIIAMIAKLFG